MGIGKAVAKASKLTFLIDCRTLKRAIAIGIPGYTQPQDNTLLNVLLMPLSPQRNYWHYADGTVMQREPAILGDDPTRMVDREAIGKQLSHRQESYS
ncbi:hypothetical protein AB0758_45385 [Tolypothrix bouteillei VB521301_2]|uniref:Uncharacterized protein n=1 Tax=Tolypothrix bouteillei VB521301 TaxID=1479485 RepID=A0A0C1NGB9_9CYAN